MHRAGRQQPFDGVTELGEGAVPAVGAPQDDEVDVGFGDLGEDLVSKEVAVPDPVALPDVQAGK